MPREHERRLIGRLKLLPCRVAHPTTHGLAPDIPSTSAPAVTMTRLGIFIRHFGALAVRVDNPVERLEFPDIDRHRRLKPRASGSTAELHAVDEVQLL